MKPTIFISAMAARRSASEMDGLRVFPFCERCIRITHASVKVHDKGLARIRSAILTAAPIIAH
jgi:hypothetical protein